MSGAHDISFKAFTFSNLNTRLYKIKLKDDKIFVSGFFKTFNGYESQSIVKLNSDGSIDSSFKSRLPEISYITSIELQSDQKIIIAGGMAFDGLNYKPIARLNPDGSIDESFNKDAAALTGMQEIAIDAQNRIYVCGGEEK